VAFFGPLLVMAGEAEGLLSDLGISSLVRPWRNHPIALLASTSSLLPCACMEAVQLGRLQGDGDS